MSETTERVLGYLGEKPKLFVQAGLRGKKFAVFKAPRLPSSVVERLARKLVVQTQDVLVISDISLRSYQRRIKTHEALTESESDRVMRVARVAERAEAVFEDKDKAARWMATPSRILGARPLDLLGSDAGANDVMDELVRIEYGDFA